jgi:catechol 2,3-dioxygenase-like lactoylglutathione lyase family enzyme
LDTDQDFRLSKIGVIMLGVADMERSVPFYRDSLGLELSAQHGGFAFFNADGVTLALSTGLMKAVGQAPGAVEVVFSVEHVRVAYEELQRRGILFLNQPRPVAGPMWAADFRDPDGHILSVFGPE